jgi:2-polyprenyl-3-methyl-5-hydroxy-6-metoxy-1,4-benzoquinol methylase
MESQIISQHIDIGAYAVNLHKDNGMWLSSAKRFISYPDDGNREYYEIEENSYWFKHRNNCITSVVRQFSPNEIFFDVGGGNGFVSKALQEAGITTVLVEPGLEGAINATRRGITNVICSTLEDAGFKLNSISAIGLFDVVEHIDNDSLFLDKIFTYISTGGLLYVTVPAYQTLWSNEDVAAGHYRRYTLKSIRAALRAANFKIEYSSYFFSLLPIPILLFRTIPSLLGLNKTTKNSRHKRQHESLKGILGTVTNKLWNREVTALSNQRKIRFGSSCLVVARKA